MAGLRRLFGHPCILVHDSSVCGTVADTPPIAVLAAGASIDCNMGDPGAGDATVAERLALSNGLGLDCGDIAVCLRALSVFAIGKEFQREAIRRAAGSSWRK